MLKSSSVGDSWTIWNNPFQYRATLTFGKLILMAIRTAELSSIGVEKRLFLFAIT